MIYDWGFEHLTYHTTYNGEEGNDGQKFETTNKSHSFYQSSLPTVETIQMWVVVFFVLFFFNGAAFFSEAIPQINTWPTCKDISGIFAKKKEEKNQY